MITNIKGLIFDFDGVIVDTETAIYNSWVTLYQREGKHIDIATYAPCLGAGYSHWDPAKYLESITAKQYDWDVETPIRQAQLEAELDQMGLMPGVIQLLDYCDAHGIAMSVASSSSRRWVGGWLEKLGIAHRFVAIHTRTDGYPVKPDPALFHAAQASMQLNANECLIIEDSENGTIAAQRAGIACCAVPNKMTAGSNFSRATYQVNSLLELIEQA